MSYTIVREYSGVRGEPGHVSKRVGRSMSRGRAGSEIYAHVAWLGLRCLFPRLQGVTEHSSSFKVSFTVKIFK